MRLRFVIWNQTSTVDYLSNNFGIELHGFFDIASIYIGTVVDFFRFLFKEKINK